MNSPYFFLPNRQLLSNCLHVFSRLLISVMLIFVSYFFSLSANALSIRPQNTSNTVEVDPQVAAPPETPFRYPMTGYTANNNMNNNTLNDSDAQNAPLLSQQPTLTAPVLPNPLNNPDTLASQMQPTDNALSQANQELLSRNAQLQRDINDLNTQVDVLVQERSGQLFMYGALTTAIALFIGFMTGWVVFGRRDRW